MPGSRLKYRLNYFSPSRPGGVTDRLDQAPVAGVPPHPAQGPPGAVLADDPFAYPLPLGSRALGDSH